MDFNNFLSKRSSDCELRKKLWYLFEKAADETQRYFSSIENPWIEIISVDEDGAKWNESGAIFIPVDASDLGVIFHEVFHSAFHGSPLWQDQNNSDWGDAFCDAFRYFMEKELLEGITNFLKKMDYELVKPSEQVKLENDSYMGRASRIINESRRNFGRFKIIWEQRNADPHASLSKYFGLA